MSGSFIGQHISYMGVHCFSRHLATDNLRRVLRTSVQAHSFFPEAPEKVSCRLSQSISKIKSEHVIFQPQSSHGPTLR